MASSTAGDEMVAAASKKQRLLFVDLPPEAQREIISHCSQSDLICLALVSRHFHELASSQLYKNFHIIFPDDDDLSFDSSIDGLASGLNTFTTSSYDYAKHLRDLSMDTLSAGLKGEASYQSYLYSASCGKFLNTLLHLTLRRARALEVFRWNIRVELSRPVYRELHRIDSIKKLHIRMQAGESYYMQPPPLPVSSDIHPQPSSTNPWGSIPPLAPLSLLPPAPPPPPHPGHSLPVVGGPPPALMPPSYKSTLKNNVGKYTDGASEPSTFSGFKNLKSLSVLDIDNLDIVSELSTCIKNSSWTLNELQLSLSDALANQARKPSPGSDADDSDVEGEFQIDPTIQNNSTLNDIDYDTIGPVRAFRAQEERKLQESMLGRILELYPQPTNTRPKAEDAQANSNAVKKDATKPQLTERAVARLALLEAIKNVCNRITMVDPYQYRPRQETFDAMAEAAREYVDNIDPAALVMESLNASNGDAPAIVVEAVSKGESSGSGSKTPVEAPPAEAPSAEDDTTADDLIKSDKTSSSKMAKKQSGDFSPEDIDIAYLEDIGDAFEEAEESSLSTAVEATLEPQQRKSSTDSAAAATPAVEAAGIDAAATSSKATETQAETHPKTAEKAKKPDEFATVAKINLENLMNRLSSFRDRSKAIGKRIDDMRAQGLVMDRVLTKNGDEHSVAFRAMVADINNEFLVVEEELDKVERQVTAINRTSARDYIRRTRGLTLSSLSIYLVPVKASVLSRSLNLSCLKQITLLNVGNQVPIWNLLAKENRQRPLGLRSIFTDNVTEAFLTFASQLEEIHELFLLERDVKSKPESFAPRGSTLMDQIRRLVLKKHIRHLRRLMIRDESTGPNWDCNEKTMVLICTQGRKLKELALSMNIHALHVFMQYVSGLVNLLAINIIHFRSHDACMSVMREILRFTVDNLSHHPGLKLEWIAMEGDRVYRVVRPNQETDDTPNEQSNSKRAKGKGTAAAAFGGGGTGSGSGSGPDVHNPFSLDSLGSESDSEDADVNVGTHLRFKTIGPLRFYDVWGIKIFEKEIQSGRL
ncbi:hypothetical protein ACQKWADRAFT_294824 [Trichoderma austrokoningii]